jgi:hypothetical protein
MPPRKKNSKEFVRRRAKELAESGRFSGWLGIEFELRYVEGLQKARVWLDSEPIRDELDILCQQAKFRMPPAASKKAPK